MSKDELPVPASRSSGHDIERDLSGTERAKRTRNPFSVFFRQWGSRLAKGTLDADTAETRAFEQNLDAHSDGVRALGQLRDAVDDYHARDELAEEHYTNALERQRAAIQRDAHQREIEAKRQKEEKHDADRAVFNAEQGLKNQERLAEVNAEIWGKRAEAEKLDAMSVADRLRAQNAGSSAVHASASEVLGVAYQRALAEGKHDEALRLMAAIQALEGK